MSTDTTEWITHVGIISPLGSVHKTICNIEFGREAKECTGSAENIDCEICRLRVHTTTPPTYSMLRVVSIETKKNAA